MGFFWKRGKTIEEEYREALRLAVQTFENFPDLSLDFSDRQVNKIIIPRLKKLIKTELANDASKGQKGITNPVVTLAGIIIDLKSWRSTEKYKEETWQQLKVLVFDKYDKLQK